MNGFDLLREPPLPRVRQNARPRSAPRTAAEPALAVVIIARNEAAHIGACIESVLRATAAVPECAIVFVDSCSTDDTVAIARRHPIRVVELAPHVECCAALARVVGESLTRSRHVLFVDGDTEIDATWLREAMRLLDAEPAIAGVGGKLRERYYRDGRLVGENPDCFGVGADVEVADQLGGNALYRRAALNAAGSFNPYVFSYEEAELAERLRQRGYSVVRLPLHVGTHHTAPPATARELWRRWRSNLILGYGQVLRLGLRDGLFWTHARRLNRYLAFDALLLLGLGAAIAALAFGSAAPVLAWAGLCAALFAAFVVRARSLRKPLRLIVVWTVWAVPLITGFLRRPRDPRTFSVATAIASDSGAPEATC